MLSHPTMQELCGECRLVTRSAFLRQDPIHGAPDAYVLYPPAPNVPNHFNSLYFRRLDNRQALPLSEWSPDDPACAARKPLMPPSAPPLIADDRRGGLGLTPASLIPALGGGPSGGGPGGGASVIPALGGGPGAGGSSIPALGGATSASGPKMGQMRGGGGGGPAGTGLRGPGGVGGSGRGGGFATGANAVGPGSGSSGGGAGSGGDSSKNQVMSAVANVLRSKLAAVPHAFGECGGLGRAATAVCLDVDRGQGGDDTQVKKETRS